jgi:tetratricopeptide (TPR) repeat protein
MKNAIALITVLSLYGAAGLQAASPLWSSLDAGPHAAGFRVMERRDSARLYRYPYDLQGKVRAVDTARPMQISIWYPAVKSAAVKMKLGEYVELMGSEQDFTVTGDARRTAGERLYFTFDIVRSATPEQRARLLSLETEGIRNAPPASGRFPLIVYSLGSPALYHASAEYLASHGYVVAIMPRLPATLGPVDTAQTREDFDAKSRDIAFLLNEVASLPFVDRTTMGVTGFSAGGRWALQEAMRNPAVLALVSLDSILLWSLGSEEFNLMPGVAPDRLRIPALHLIRREWVPREDLAPWKAMANSDRTRMIFEEPLDHFDFASLGWAAALAGLRGERKNEVEKTFLAFNRLTRWFFDAHLKGDKAALARLGGGAETISLAPASVVIERTARLSATPDPRAFLETAAEDVSRALAMYRRLAADHGAPPFPEGTLNAIGYQLLAQTRIEDAVKVLTLNAEMFPRSANVFDSLADAQLAAGRRDEAATLSRKVLEILAADRETPEARRDLIRQSAEDRLKTLAGSS